MYPLSKTKKSAVLVHSFLVEARLPFHFLIFYLILSFLSFREAPVPPPPLDTSLYKNGFGAETISLC